LIITCGTVLVDKNSSILLAHPTGSGKNTWSIPKGIHDKTDKSYLDTAIREFLEETSIDISNTELIEVGDYTYPNGIKVLKGFYGSYDKVIDITKLKCTSMVSPKKNRLGGFPEVDGYMLLEKPYDLSNLHVTQVALICDILKSVMG